MRARRPRRVRTRVDVPALVLAVAAIAASIAASVFAIGGTVGARAEAAGLSAQVAIDVSGVATATEPAIRLDPPTPVVAASEAPTTAIVNRSTCRQDLSGAVMTISIPSISMSCPVHAGGQTVLDSGAVTLLDQAEMSSRLAHSPGAPGTLWIGGHRSSHGAAFAEVPALADGAVIEISDGTTTASYQIVGRLYVSVEKGQVVASDGVPSGAATADAILRADRGVRGATRLLLQTCDGEDHRWMIYADLIGVTSD